MSNCSAVYSCFTLTQVFIDIEGSTDFNVSLILQPGRHGLNLNQNLSELKYLSMKSEEYQSPAIIICENSSKLNFHSIIHVHIQGITFSRCSGSEVNQVSEFLI